MTINVTRNSTTINMTHLYHRKRNDIEAINRHKQMIEKKLYPLEFKTEVANGVEPPESCVHFYGYLLTSVCSKSTMGPKESMLRSFIALTHEGEIASVDVLDPNFIHEDVFPKEDSYFYVENLTYVTMTVIKKSDLSFKHIDDPNSVGKESTSKYSRNFSYASYKMTSKSSFRTASANSNDQSMALKALVQDKQSLKKFKSHLKYVLT